ncbi:MAG: hypothetical protein KKC18_05775 [Chloroflexi bacterium]|nr:hypothetical protein [Chloroflexota bacterium]
MDRLLEYCLRELSRTGDIEAGLLCYPEHADRLRPLLEMAQIVLCYYGIVPEAPGELLAGRERLLTLAAQQRVVKSPATSPTMAATV